MNEKLMTGTSIQTHKSFLILQGRAQPFSAFNRAARNTQAMFGREESETWEQVEVG